MTNVSHKKPATAKHRREQHICNHQYQDGTADDDDLRLVGGFMGTGVGLNTGVTTVGTAVTAKG